ncbi:hypothetical protein J5N97_000064 [Dioscorea zingiberensis]|uniref:PRELI/MSF1 domain-containing protein n=1 Tax=Dioscorea zingiberensis TaxID=325984 RepID=A0A9D5BW80_9LILI|nr:hypothetical protein J5N97_000064 [Dioscorea zingiberensis]
MVLTYTQEHVYRHPWDRGHRGGMAEVHGSRGIVSSLHVVDVHTLSRRFDPDAGRLHTTRSITVRSPPLPFPLRARIGGAPAVFCHCIETTVADAPRRHMEVVARNAGLRRLIEVEERSIYEPHPLEPDRWTMFRQETRIRCKALLGLGVNRRESRAAVC